MIDDRRQEILASLERGEAPDDVDVREADLDDDIVGSACAQSLGRRWLRGLEDLSQPLADRLIGYPEDFRASRRDRSLETVVRRASLPAALANQDAIAASPAASAFWSRVSSEPDVLQSSASEIVAGDDTHAAESTLYLLVLDPIDPFRIGEERRVAIARAGLHSPSTSVRSLAAEYLYDHRPEHLARVYDRLVHDDDERIRGLAWSAGLRADTAGAMEHATRILNDDTVGLDIRRSALSALGTNFSTPDVIDMLAEQVLNPERDLALDAANLLYRLHRHPVIATAAARSPHQEVREIGEFLLDPYRGSPAAGGSRPGDPTRSDIFAEMIRNTEERMLEDFPETEGDKQ